MRFMMFVKANPESEAGVLPTEEQLTEMVGFNQQLADAGVLLAGEGLHPSSKGTRIRIADGKTRVLDGPFAEAKELVAGFWLIEVSRKQEAIDWAKRVPFREGEVELRPLYETEDFAVDPAEEPGGWRDQELAQRAAHEAAPPARKPGTRRYACMLLADENTERGMAPSEALLTEMGALMTEMTEAGAILAGEGLRPSSEGVRVRYSGTQRTVIDGPFAETKELVAGFTILQAATKQEAIDFSRRCLEIHVRGTGIDHGQIEVREVFETEDFPVEPTEQPGGWRDQELRLRERLARGKGS